MIRRVLTLGAVLVVMTALTAAFDAQAQDDDFEEDEELYYEKESATYSEFQIGGSYFKISDDDDRFSGGVGLVVGAHVTPHVSMEVQYGWQEYSSTHLASYNLRYTLLTDSIQPWVKAGIGLMGGRPNHAFLLLGRLDAGANFFLNEQWAIAPSVGYAGAKHSNHIIMGNIGVVYYFE